MLLEDLKTAEEGWKERHKDEIARAESVQSACEDGSILEGGFLKAFADNPATAAILTGLGTDFRIFETYIVVALLLSVHRFRTRLGPTGGAIS